MRALGSAITVADNVDDPLGVLNGSTGDYCVVMGLRKLLLGLRSRWPRAQVDIMLDSFLVSIWCGSACS